MEWKGRRQSDNVEDRRGGGYGGGGMGAFGGRGLRLPVGRGGMSFSTIIFLIIIVVALRFMGIDVMQLLDDGSGGSGNTGGYSQQANRQSQAEQEMTAFVRTVLAETEDTWQQIFADQGSAYQNPMLVLFDGSTGSACGMASAATGPFYCPGDRKVYLDTAFFRQLKQKFGASGDFAQAYVIAHEVGHHVQNLTGILPRFNEMRRRLSEAEANRMSVRVELQADCFAGIWGKRTAQKGLLENGDLDEALNAARQIGDDTLQKRAQGYVVPESFNHGTSQQRMTWFKRGFDSGEFSACDTFSGDI